MKMVTDPDDPTFETLDNQHKIMVDLESRIKELDQKINRTHVGFAIFSLFLVKLLLIFF